MAEMWFYTRAGKQMEPVSTVDLKRLIAEGTVKPSDLVWKDGLANWVRASSMKELIGVEISAPDQNRNADLDQAPRQLSKHEGSALASSGRVRTPHGASNTGIIVFGVLGALILLGALAGGVFILLAVSKPGATKESKGDPINPDNLIKGEVKYNLNLRPDEMDNRKFSFRKGVQYEFTVKTRPNHNGVDVDLIIYHSSNRMEASDTNPVADCFLTWTPLEDGEYRVEIHNLNQFARNVTVKSVVTIRELKAEKVIDDPAEPLLPVDVLQGKGITEVPLVGPGKEETFRYRVQAGHKVTFRLTPLADAAKLDLNLIVANDKNPETIIAQDVEPAKVASVEFLAKTTEIVRVRVVNASKFRATTALSSFDVSP